MTAKVATVNQFDKIMIFSLFELLFNGCFDILAGKKFTFLQHTTLTVNQVTSPTNIIQFVAK